MTTLKLTRPICSIDVETTGLDLCQDRIWSLSVTKIMEDDKRIQFHWLMDPGKPLTPEAEEKTGMTWEKLKGLPKFGDYAQQIVRALEGCDLCGFNCDNFDVPMLDEHFCREGMQWNLDGVNIIDVGTLWKILDPRTLEAGVRKFCGREHVGAHDAQNDTIETINVLTGMIGWYGDELAALDVAGVAAKSKQAERVDLAGKIVLNKDGEPVYAFGKPKGVRVVDDPGFGQWILRSDFCSNTKMHVQRILDHSNDNLFGS